MKRLRSQSVKLGTVSPVLNVPSHIVRPPYPAPEMEEVFIGQRFGGEVEVMRDACVKAATALKYAGSLVKEGVTTDEIDRKTHAFIVDALKSYPSPLLYSGFPKSICTSVNEVLCHGIPDDRPLQNGDILNIDVSVYTENRVHGDCSEMFVVGECDEGCSK